MADVIPFRGLRYSATAGDLATLIAPPYDIISNDERERLHALSPHNVIRVEYGRDEPGRDKYAAARDALDRWTSDGVLVHDAAPAFYLTEHTFRDGTGSAVRRGLLGALRLYPEGSDQVLPHEHTIPKDRADRLSLIRAARANTSPIFGMVDDADGRLAALLGRGATPQQLVGEAAVGDERHRIWRVDDPQSTGSIRELLTAKRVYLADGHHRYEVAREYLAEDRAAGRRLGADDPAAFVLAYLCALRDPGLRIFPTHRIVRGAAAALETAAARSFEAQPASSAEGLSIGLVRDGAIRALTPRRELDRSAMPAAWHGVATAEAETFLVAPARTAGAEVSFTHDMNEALAAARGDTLAVLVAPVDGPTIKRVADQGERLPIKTTYFYPKVPAGLVIRPLD